MCPWDAPDIDKAVPYKIWSSGASAPARLSDFPVPTKGGINSIGKNEQTTFCNPQEHETLKLNLIKNRGTSIQYFNLLHITKIHQVSQPRHPSFCARWQLGRHQPHMQWYQISDTSVPADLERRKNVLPIEPYPSLALDRGFSNHLRVMQNSSPKGAPRTPGGCLWDWEPHP